MTKEKWKNGRKMEKLKRDKEKKKTLLVVTPKHCHN